jgi:hypothetical protein
MVMEVGQLAAERRRQRLFGCSGCTAWAGIDANFNGGWACIDFFDYVCMHACAMVGYQVGNIYREWMR